MRLSATTITALLLLPIICSSIAGAQPPGISDGGADVRSGGGASASVTVQGGYTEIPRSSGGTGTSSPVTSSSGGEARAVEPTGDSGGGGPVNRDPLITYPRGEALPDGADLTDTPVCDGVEVGVGSCVVGIAPPATPSDLGVPATPQPVVDVTNLVSRAVTAMQLEPPPMCFAPGTADTGAVGLVGLHAWAYFCPDQIRESTTGVVTRVATSGPVTVTATAVNSAIAINWGDKSIPTICPGVFIPFTPYVDAVDAVPIPIFGDAPSPTCGHFIGKSSTTEPLGLFNVSASSLWVVYWTATTPTTTMGGVIPTPLTSTYTHRIGELQVLGVPGVLGMIPGGIPTMPTLPG